MENYLLQLPTCCASELTYLLETHRSKCLSETRTVADVNAFEPILHGDAGNLVGDTRMASAANRIRRGG